MRPRDFVGLPNFWEYAKACGSPERSQGPVHYIRPGHPIDLDYCSNHKSSFENLIRPWAQNAISSRSKDRATVFAIASRPELVPAAYLAACTGRQLRYFDSLDELAENLPQLGDHAVLVAAAGDFDDPLLFSFLESVKAGKLEERSLDTIRQISLVTGRDIAATSWMVAKLILAWREGPIKRASVRYLVPNEDGSEVTSCFVGTESASIIRSRVRNEQLIQLYSEPCDLIAIRAHGSEACANGGND